MRNSLILLCIIVLSLASCRKQYAPKPRGYFRIDFPEKKHQIFDKDCPFTFEYPIYMQVINISNDENNPCWWNISAPEFKAKIHLTYKPLHNDLSSHIEDVRKLAYKHIVKADDIQEERVVNSNDNVNGLIYNITGNTASSISFFLTDSSTHFLSGALYFSAQPNKDSLAPIIQFFQKDVVHLTESLSWK